MTADLFLQVLTQVSFILIFLVVLAGAIRRPRRAKVDAALFFGAIALIVAESWLTESLPVGTGPIWFFIVVVVLVALPYLLLRLVDSVAGVPAVVSWIGIAGIVGAAILLAIYHGPSLPLAVTLLIVAYFVALTGYDAAKIVHVALNSSGVTRQRMRAVAIGTGCLGLVIAVAGLDAIFPDKAAGFLRGVSDVLALGCVTAYFIGFAPPTWLRRAWQSPALRAFLGRSADLARLPAADVVQELERGVESALGVERVVIALWDEPSSRLRAGGSSDDVGSQGGPVNGDGSPVGPTARRAFVEQRELVVGDIARQNPVSDADNGAEGDDFVLAVPMTAGDRRLGVLAAYAPRPPLFIDDDLALARVLADQAAVILENRALIDEAGRVRAREEATRLKDDFLSAAAHDLKTPLTSLIAQAQLLELRAKRHPSAPVDPNGLHGIVQASERLRRLVGDLLDVHRVERGDLIGRCEMVDLTALLTESARQISTPRHSVVVEADGAITGLFDPIRLAQLADNLLDNAVKYSPDGGEVRMDVRLEGDHAHVTVADQGIGIPTADLPHLFDRFHRGTNVDDRRFSGMGLGLYICKAVAEQHGGRLWAESAGPGRGSSFHVVLPLTPEDRHGAAGTAIVAASNG